MAARFGTTRKPVSGRQRDKDGDDCEHPVLHIQQKHGAQNSREFRLWDAAAVKALESGKVPIITITAPRRSEILVLCRIEDLDKVAKEVVRGPQA